MASLRFKQVILIAVTIFSLGCKTDRKDDLQAVLQYEEGSALGTTYHIQYEVDHDSIRLRNEIEKVFENVNRSMSTYIPTSDISKINKGDSTIVVDPYFKEVFFKAQEVWRKTNGMFDPTVGALVNAWGFGPDKALKKIGQEQVDSILEFTGFDKVSVKENGSVHKDHPYVYFDFNALAKGYTLDLIGRMFDTHEVENYIIEIGGEIVAKGKNVVKDKDWVVAIDNPMQQEGERTLIAKLKLNNQAMATSGNYRKFRIDSVTGDRYVHTINPKTGYTQKSDVLSVTVVAPTCMEADAYATAFMAMPFDASKALLGKLKDVEAYFISAGGKDSLKEYKTEGFRKLLVE
ncbi:FAD:protein FMN transferase [Zhouia spongiae]|uniref:FAD:protein FMN transferase n=1 Tax=Zhouia spongiae TaxID=2202721 RepID=A0ABY3YHZ3_9FLAO|nr:FAD:protein FMN transferase [Zhouia spongiae]UNY97343.1 FAD:protein FMN transferase [Zhouia spongiae]